MDLREITPKYYAAPQINPEDLAALPALGFTTVIDNRPDAEIPPSHHAARMEEFAKAAGLDFVILPLTHQTLTPENTARQREILENAEGKVLAYCASGTRSTVAWALGHVGSLSPQEIIESAANGGYDLAAMGLPLR